jgi:quinol-cytochrome oxidoreductase complex cytochrome b subunit
VNTLVLPVPAPTSTFGFAIIALIAMQLLSGFFLAWYYIPEPGLVIELREEMFEETKYGYEVFNIHVRGIDAIFILSYFHILKKIYLKNYIIYESDG